MKRRVGFVGIIYVIAGLAVLIRAQTIAIVGGMLIDLTYSQPLERALLGVGFAV